MVNKAATIPAVGAFLDSMGDNYPGDDLEGPALVGMLRGDAGATLGVHRNVMRRARNAAVHYPVPGSDEFATVMRDAIGAGELGTVSSYQKMHTLRAEFADRILVQTAIEGLDEDGIRDLFREVGRTTVAIVHMAETAMGLWFAAHGVTSPI